MQWWKLKKKTCTFIYVQLHNFKLPVSTSSHSVGKTSGFFQSARIKQRELTFKLVHVSRSFNMYIIDKDLIWMRMRIVFQTSRELSSINHTYVVGSISTRVWSRVVLLVEICVTLLYFHLSNDAVQMYHTRFVIFDKIEKEYNFVICFLFVDWKMQRN